MKLCKGASTLKASRSIGVGVVIRNDEGIFLAAACKNFSIQTDPSSTETIVAFHTVEFAGYEPFGHIIADIRGLVDSFRSYCLSFIVEMIMILLITSLNIL